MQKYKKIADSLARDIVSKTVYVPQYELSKPYNFVIVNAGATVLNVNLFDAFNNLGKTNNGNDIKISVTMDNGGNITYESLLRSLSSSPFNAGMFYIQASSQEQAQQSISFTWRDNNGAELTENLYPKTDPMQKQANVLILEPKKPITIDGYASVQFTVLGDSSVTFSVYPTEIVNLTATLYNGDGIRENSLPNICQQSV